MSQAIVACGIFKDEVEAARRSLGLQVPVLYLPGAPCTKPAAFPARLARALKRATAQADDVVVLIGECHPDVDVIVAECGARRAAMVNCFDVLLEGRSKELCRVVNTFFTTPAWLRQWRLVRNALGWDETDVRQHFGIYERILILDAGVAPYTDSQVLSLFDDTDVIVEIESVPLSGLIHFMEGELTLAPSTAGQRS